MFILANQALINPEILILGNGWIGRPAAVAGFPNPISDMLMGIRILVIECLIA